MAVLRMDHVGLVVEDLEAAVGFFADLGLEAGDPMSVEGAEVDRIIGLEGARSDLVFVQTPDGRSRIELTRFGSPPYEGGSDPLPAHAPGIRHLTFAVDDLDATLERLRARGAELVGEVVRYGDAYRLCYLRGPAEIIVELAEPLG